MALSDYDCLAFGPDGKPSNGVLNCPDGQSVEIRKNWLYVHDKKMWHKDRGYIKHTIAQFNEGDIHIAGLSIIGKRGRQENIFFVFVEYNAYPGKGKHISLHMAGVAAYGWDDPTNRILKAWGKRLPPHKEKFLGWLTTAEGKKFVTIDLLVKGKNGKEKFLPEVVKLKQTARLDTRWTGLTKSTTKEFFKWLAQVADDYGKPAKEWFAKINQKKALRFNQGDAYFAQHLKKSIPATRPGKATTPVFMKVVKAWAKKGETHVK